MPVGQERIMPVTWMKPLLGSQCEGYWTRIAHTVQLISEPLDLGGWVKFKTKYKNLEFNDELI